MRRLNGEHRLMEKSAKWMNLAAVFLLLLCKVHAESQNGSQGLALTPPRGWNSYNSFSWIISEEEFLDNARFVSQNLLKFGYEYVVVDFLWYRKLEAGASVWSAGHDLIDEWGRPMPDPDRWPSSRNGSGFTEVAQQVHAMGLKFGIHVMRGISTAAVNSNSPILGAKGSPDGARGRPWQATDIAVKGTECKWMKCCFMGVNSNTEGGRAFVKSLYNQYASWGVDFIKHDCVFGVDDLRVDEIELVSQAIQQTGRPIVYSLSPGVRATPDIAMKVKNISNMYRVTADDWDTWSDLLTHFDVARDFAAAGLMGATNAQGRSWPDLDMLPLGWLTDPGARVGPHRSCNLSPAEERTQVSLWAMAKSPLMYGGDLRVIDDNTLSLITNPLLLDINAHSINNHELLHTSSHNSDEALKLVDCKEVYHLKWFFKSTHADQICWAPRDRNWRKGGVLPSGCFKWTKTATSSPSPITNVPQDSDIYADKGFSKSSWKNGCIVARVVQGVNATLTLSRMRSVAGCSERSNWVWRLTMEGKLLHEGSGLCAAPLSSEGTRTWVARGSSGQVFHVAFFNLASNDTYMSISIDAVVRSLTVNHSGEEYRGWYKKITAAFNNIAKLMWLYFHKHEVGVPGTLICNGLDVWSRRDLGEVGESLGVSVESHGAAVFSLVCNRRPGLQKILRTK